MPSERDSSHADKESASHDDVSLVAADLATSSARSRAAHASNGEAAASRIAQLQLKALGYPESGVEEKASGDPSTASGPEVVEAARAGVAGTGAKLPHFDAIQRSFGRHDVSGVQAHTGGQAAAASAAIGAQAYATGNDVAFANSSPDLHTAAHEAAHTIQQRAGVQLKGGVGEEGDTHERQADEVADAVVAGRSAEELLDGVAGVGNDEEAQDGQQVELPPLEQVQRKVFIGGAQKTKSFWHGKTGAGDRRVSTMMGDDKNRFFKDKAEMFAYAKGNTQDIGLVGDTWVRLDDKLVVLGETHFAPGGQKGHPRSANAIIAATGTTRYAHEAITAKPAGASEALTSAMGERETVVRDKLGMTAGDAQQGEDFFPKLIRMLGDVGFGFNKQFPNHVSLDDLGGLALRWSILYARTCTEPALLAVYQANQSFFDKVEPDLSDDAKAKSVINASEANQVATRALQQAMVTVARAKVAQTTAATDQGTLASFGLYDQAASPSYADPSDSGGKLAANQLRDEGERGRDLSMLQHIKASKDAGHQLYGMGEIHRPRLAPVLDAEGIEHMSSDEFLKKQPKG